MLDTSIKHLENTYLKYPILLSISFEIENAISLMLRTYNNNNFVYVCGNGGSASDSEHIVGELMKAFTIKRPLSKQLKSKISDIYPEDDDYLGENLELAMPTFSLVSQTSLITAISNDISSDLIFAQQLIGYGKEGDCLLVLSTSGNSKNVLYAAKIAKVLDMKVIALTGRRESELSKVADITIHAPADSTFEVQELHLPIYHTISMCLESELFG